MHINLSSGNYHIIASGSTFLYDPWGDLSISIEGNKQPFLSLVLKFSKDNETGPRIETTVEDDTLIVTCYQFSGAQDRLKSPTHIATINDKEISILFSSQFIGNKEQATRKVEYTIFAEK